MNITVTIGKLPPFEIEDATDSQVVEALKFVEGMHDPFDEPVPNRLHSMYAPKLETN